MNKHINFLSNYRVVAFCSNLTVTTDKSKLVAICFVLVLSMEIATISVINFQQSHPGFW